MYQSSQIFKIKTQLLQENESVLVMRSVAVYIFIN